MEQYNVTGMSCAACSARVEKAVSKVTGVETCSVNLLTGTMGVEGSAPTSEIIRAVTDAGYGASLKDEKRLTGRTARILIIQKCQSFINVLFHRRQFWLCSCISLWGI